MQNILIPKLVTGDNMKYYCEYCCKFIDEEDCNICRQHETVQVTTGEYNEANEISSDDLEAAAKMYDRIIK